MFLRILAHIEPLQRYAQFRSKNFGHLCFSYSGRADKKKAGQWLVLVQQSGFRHLYSLHYLAHSFVLTIYFCIDTFVQSLQSRSIIFLHCKRIDFTNTGQYLRNQVFIYCLLLSQRSRMHFPVSSGLIYQINRLVRKKSVVDITSTCPDGIRNDV